VDAIPYINAKTGRPILVESGRIDVTILLEKEQGTLEIDLPRLRVVLDDI
jgi:hypothetical protein